MSPKMQQRAWVRDGDEAESTPSTNSQHTPTPPLPHSHPHPRPLCSLSCFPTLSGPGSSPAPVSSTGSFSVHFLSSLAEEWSPCRTHGLTQAFVTPFPTGPEGEDICRVGKDQTPGQSKAVLSPV